MQEKSVTTTAEESSGIINAVDRALDILLYINTQKSPVGISQISQAMGIYKSTVFRTLITLENKHFVRQDQETGKYSLGISLYSMGRAITMYDVFTPFAEALAEEFHESVNVSVLDTTTKGPYKSTIVVKAEQKANVLSVNPKLGSSCFCYSSSVGKCLLAFAPDINPALMAQYEFQPYTRNTITSLEKLQNALEDIRRVGYAVDDEEQEIGLTCVGVPIFNNDCVAIASISITGPTQRMREHDFESMIHRLKEVSQEITKLL